MKTILGTMALTATLAALAACQHDDAPARTPAQETTTTTSYPSTTPAMQPQATYVQQPPQESASSTYQQDPALGQEPSQKPMASTPIDPSLPNVNHEPGASPKPVTGAGPTAPGPVNAKQPDKKSPNAAAATDQGNSKPEVQISARIRKSMMASKTLTFGAKNAKVITQGSKVTLRGTVKTDAEKNEIAGIARNTDGVTEVDDQLVVKP